MPPLLIDLWQWLIKPGRGCSDPPSPDVIHRSWRECVWLRCCTGGMCVRRWARRGCCSDSWERQKDVGHCYVRARSGRLRANLHAQTWKSWVLIGWNYGGVRRWMQWSGEENTDGDGVEQDLEKQPRTEPLCAWLSMWGKKIPPFAWPVGDRVYFIRKEWAKVGLGGGEGRNTVDLKWVVLLHYFSSICQLTPEALMEIMTKCANMLVK